MSIKVENYVIENYPFAKKAGERFKMDPLVILTQGAYESAWGTSGISKVDTSTPASVRRMSSLR